MLTWGTFVGYIKKYLSSISDSGENVLDAHYPDLLRGSGWGAQRRLPGY